jgi:hypothetical protein
VECIELTDGVKSVWKVHPTIQQVEAVNPIVQILTNIIVLEDAFALMAFLGLMVCVSNAREEVIIIN